VQGVRGLGGGIEYAIAADFCATLTPQFLDDPKPTCAQLRDAVRRPLTAGAVIIPSSVSWR